ncbi:replication initiation protein [Halodesulfovibrio marinisediminis]|uniref:Replicase family protein n=1 Tax=Halodesulfovibrio marinisediminis DSM 17456 TaxID=1121457 RepID=A0A1N6FNF0_9BACT|nr:replication initiation protein [Halodesulfovibrio marinisediminis]SIN96796.1 Replicase family protein [Halodesulfovibrio marinisediminis DSM 17456]
MHNVTMCSPPKERFIEHLEERLYYGVGKQLDRYGDKVEALQRGNYVQLSRREHAYLGVDLDYQGAATRWEEVNLPEPTLILINPETGHANVFWELKVPVLKACRMNNNNVRGKPVKWFKAIQKGFTKVLDGDFGYTSASIKNPFSSNWIVIWRDKQYSLEELAEYSPEESTCGYFMRDEDVDFAGRNDELFYVIRKKAYQLVFKLDSDLFDARVEEEAHAYNEQTIPVNWPDRGPLPRSEVQGVARGIIRWVHQHKYDTGFKQRAKNHGVMKLPKIDKSLPEDVKEIATMCRQARGAAYTHQTRKMNTEQKIINAIDSLCSEQMPITKKAISTLSGVSVRNLNNYKYLYKSYINSN